MISQWVKRKDCSEQQGASLEHDWLFYHWNCHPQITKLSLIHSPRYLHWKFTRTHAHAHTADLHQQSSSRQPPAAPTAYGRDPFISCLTHACTPSPSSAPRSFLTQRLGGRDATFVSIPQTHRHTHSGLFLNTSTHEFPQLTTGHSLPCQVSFCVKSFGEKSSMWTISTTSLLPLQTAGNIFEPNQCSWTIWPNRYLIIWTCHHV